MNYFGRRMAGEDMAANRRLENSNSCYEIALNYTCNAKCRFCSQGDFDKTRLVPFKQIARHIYRAWNQGFGRIGFTGGDPLVSPDILKAISLAKHIGFSYIRVQTNGIALGDKKFCESLAAAGLTLCKFSFASDIPQEHDMLLGVPGAFEKAMAGLSVLRALKIRISVNMVITKYTYYRIADILRTFLAKGVRNFIIVYPFYIGAMHLNRNELGVSLKECIAPFAEALDLMDALGLSGELLFLNVPACFLKNRESLSIGLAPYNTVVANADGVISDLDIETTFDRKHVAGCKRCRFKTKCKGLDRTYIKIFGDYVPPQGGVFSANNFAAPNFKARSAFFTENEECLFEILKDGKEKATNEVLAAALKLPLCKDCRDGNSVINAGIRLEEKGLISRRLANGHYYWKLNTKKL